MKQVGPDFTVLCIEENCHKQIKIKDSIWRGPEFPISDWYCSENCKRIDALKHPDGDKNE